MRLFKKPVLRADFQELYEKAIKAFAKALKMDFETNASESPYEPTFLEKIIKGREDVKNGKGVKIAVEDLWK